MSHRFSCHDKACEKATNVSLEVTDGLSLPSEWLCVRKATGIGRSKALLDSIAFFLKMAHEKPREWLVY